MGHDVMPYALGLGLRGLVLCHESTTETYRSNNPGVFVMYIDATSHEVFAVLSGTIERDLLPNNLMHVRIVSLVSFRVFRKRNNLPQDPRPHEQQVSLLQ